ncbi:prolipoprotein diacylglyceryl transferase [Candidatus Solincola sp.]|nr:prolipoprotein diacylglyceryl transferase [Actinomycetota bacterium]
MRPVLFHIGSFPVYSYGVFLFLAFLAGVLVAGRELRRKRLDGSAIYPVGAVAAVSGVLGARLFYVLGHWREFSPDWLSAFDLNMRGLVFYGGLALAVPACALTVRRMGLPAGKVADAVGLTLPLSLAVARVGCFLNGCCGGKPSRLPWAVTFPGSSTAVHPTQLYELLLDLALFFFLLRLRKSVAGDWDLFLLAVGGYGVVRFLNEFFRYHAESSAGIFFQVTSVAAAVIFLSLVWYRERRARREPEPATLSSGSRDTEGEGHERDDDR